MNAFGARGVDSQLSRIFEAIQQGNDVLAGRRLRVAPQPGKAGLTQFWIDRQQPGERVLLRVGHPDRERLEGLLSRPSARGQPDPLQHRGRRNQAASSSRRLMGWPGGHSIKNGCEA
jgi:hypothetical protein